MFEKSIFYLVGISVVCSTVIASVRNEVENVNEVEENWVKDQDIREFDRLIRRHSEKDNYPDNLRTFINFPKIYRSGKWKNEAARISLQKLQISTSPSIFSRFQDHGEEEETKKSLPDRFAYVAREFYRYYSKQRVGSMKKKFGHESSGSVNFETTQLPGNTTVQIDWRSIINAPTSGCPKGQRKDRNGRCRKTLW